MGGNLRRVEMGELGRGKTCDETFGMDWFDLLNIGSNHFHCLTGKAIKITFLGLCHMPAKPHGIVPMYVV